MNYKRAILVSIVAYLLTFVAALIGFIALGIDPTTGNLEYPDTVWYVGIASTTVISILASLYFFKDKKTKPTVNTGFHFGLVLLATGFILDMLTIFPTLLTGNSALDLLLEYYAHPLFLLSLVTMLAATTLTAKYLESKKTSKRKK